MSEKGQMILDKYRQNKPLVELERKWNKAQGRHSNQFWCQEWLDLAHARADKTARFFLEYEKNNLDTNNQ